MNQTEKSTDPSIVYQPWKFFLLVFILTIPGYIFGSRKLPIPVDLPVSALMVLLPTLVAAWLTYRQRGKAGVKTLFKRVVDYRKITPSAWYLPTLLLAPLIYFLAYVVMRMLGEPLPGDSTPILSVLVLGLVFIVGAILEELGWMGYAIDPLQDRWGALKAALLVGLVWQVWHLIPDLQLGHSGGWIFWHSLQGIAMRILMVWIYNNTGRSVFTSIVMHTMDNISWVMFPGMGDSLDPFYTAIFTILAAGIVIIVWDSRTLSSLRWSRKDHA